MAVDLVKKPNLNQVSFSAEEKGIEYGLNWGIEASWLSICLFESEKRLKNEQIEYNQSELEFKENFTSELEIPDDIQKFFSQCLKHL